MNIRFVVTIAIALLVLSVARAENRWADYRFAPDALREIDLASDTAWTLASTAARRGRSR